MNHTRSPFTARRLLVIGIATCALAAASCKKSASSSTSTAPKAAPLSKVGEVCRASIAKAVECKDLFVPALVQSRVKFDDPAGIAAEGATPEGMQKLVATAHEEFAADSAPDRVEAQCGQMDANAAPELETMVTEMGKCLAKTACAEYVPCTITVHENMMETVKAMKANTAH